MEIVIKYYTSQEAMMEDLRTDMHECDKIIIPLTNKIAKIDQKTGEKAIIIGIGLIFIKCGSMNTMLVKDAAEDLLNDGILTTKKIPIELSYLEGEVF